MKKDVSVLSSYLDKLYEEKKYPGMTLCLRGPEGVILEKAYGFADADKNKAIDPDTMFGIASMSKSMATLACAILECEGKLSFSDPVSKYFPNFSIPGSPDETVTLRHLAMHTTGIPPLPLLTWSIVMNTPGRDTESNSQAIATAPNKMATIDELVDYISTSEDYKPLGAPGEYMSYSNEGYALLSYVVDQAAGIKLEDFLKERIFKPLGMERTILDLDGSEARELSEGNISDLFDTRDDGEEYSDQIFTVVPPYRACASVKSTARDMARYYQMLSQRGEFEGKQIIDAKAVEILIGREFPETGEPFYCFGLTKRLFEDRVICEHGGGLHGVSSSGGFIEGGYSITSLCNKSNVSLQDFNWACYNFILGLELDISHSFSLPSGKDFSAPHALIGRYKSIEDIPENYCIVRLEDGELIANYYKKDHKLLYCKDTLFSARHLDKPEEQRTTMRFLLRDGKAWGVRCYNRIYQRVE